MRVVRVTVMVLAGIVVVLVWPGRVIVEGGITVVVVITDVTVDGGSVIVVDRSTLMVELE